jgi:signal transduction protein with GAF and PtsI domain
MDGYRHIGTGQAVFESAQPAEGVLRWLDSPADVLAFVETGNAAETIVLARGGTTTFLAPALSARVRGIMTLQGAPESHLGILSREFGIPCVMSVQFTEGVTTSRGETVPADGTRLRLDVSAGAEGHIYAQES